MKIYISGRITGDPDYKLKFARAAEAVRHKGSEPLNPAAGDEGLSDKEAMRQAVRLLLEADAILMLTDWPHSRGAFAELLLARRLGLTVLYEEEYCHE